MINALAVENFQLKEENGAAKELLISVFNLFIFKICPCPPSFYLCFSKSFIILIESARVF